MYRSFKLLSDIFLTEEKIPRTPESMKESSDNEVDGELVYAAKPYRYVQFSDTNEQTLESF